jgi:hypothetical protein
LPELFGPTIAQTCGNDRKALEGPEVLDPERFESHWAVWPASRAANSLEALACTVQGLEGDMLTATTTASSGLMRHH